MEDLEKRLEAMLVKFGQETARLPGDVAGNLRSAIESSEGMQRNVLQAVGDGRIASFRAEGNPAGSGGSYSEDNVIRIKEGVLQGMPYASFTEGDLVFVLGHEVEHANRKLSAVHDRGIFQEKVEKIAHAAAPRHRYTEALAGVLDAHRMAESAGEIEGFNAVVNATREQNGSVELKSAYLASPRYMQHFIELDDKGKASLKPGFTLNDDMTMSRTGANLEQIGRNYYDGISAETADGRSLSVNQNRYAAEHIADILERERDGRSVLSRAGSAILDAVGLEEYDPAPRIEIDFKKLGLDKKLIEAELGLEDAQLIYDTSDGKSVPLHLESTSSLVPARGMAPDSVATAPAQFASAADSAATFDPTHPGHPQHAIHQQAVAAVQALNDQLKLPWSAESDALAASATLMAARDPLIQRIDHVVLSEATAGRAAGQTVFVVQGELDRMPNFTAYMDTQAATRTPAGDSFRELDTLQAQRGLQQGQEHNLQATMDANTQEQQPLRRGV
jgi:hypothetical protein